MVQINKTHTYTPNTQTKITLERICQYEKSDAPFFKTTPSPAYFTKPPNSPFLWEKSDPPPLSQEGGNGFQLRSLVREADGGGGNITQGLKISIQEYRLIINKHNQKLICIMENEKICVSFRLCLFIIQGLFSSD